MTEIVGPEKAREATEAARAKEEAEREAHVDAWVNHINKQLAASPLLPFDVRPWQDSKMKGVPCTGRIAEEVANRFRAAGWQVRVRPTVFHGHPCLIFN